MAGSYYFCFCPARIVGLLLRAATVAAVAQYRTNGILNRSCAAHRFEISRNNLNFNYKRKEKDSRGLGRRTRLLPGGRVTSRRRPNCCLVLCFRRPCIAAASCTRQGPSLRRLAALIAKDPGRERSTEANENEPATTTSGGARRRQPPRRGSGSGA
jgi:hypothetical protein